MLTLGLFEGALDRDVTREIVLNVAANDTPIYSALTGRGQSRETGNVKFEWYTADPAARRTQINNAPDDYDGTDTDLVVDDASVFYPDSLILAEATGEVMYCRAVNTGTNTITVVRGVGATSGSAGSVADDAYLMNYSHARNEGSDLPTARHTGRSQAFNYTQTFRRAVQLSGTIDSEQTKTENERAAQRRHQFVEVLRDMELAFIHGAAANDTTNADGEIVHSTGGLLNAITTNVDNVGGTMSMSRWTQFSEMAFAYGATEKLMFSGSTLMKTLNDIYAAKLQVRPDDGAVGLANVPILTPYGTINAVYHPHMKGAYAQYGIVVDPMQVYLRTKGGGRGGLRLREDIGEAGKDAIVDEWFEDAGLEWGSEAFHAVIKGVTGAA